ncbi:MAG: FtsW/RodA/SpoVE family cell cycle protein [Lachnospiraceae bacterium]|nr:FtsW/RodA/SpoVE family cell cycle protein [Lachnospiraceae bacterium]
MVLFLIELGKYINIVLLGLYTLISFVALKKKDTDPKNGIYGWLEFFVYVLFASSITCLALSQANAGEVESVKKTFITGGLLLALLFAYARMMYFLYPELNRLLLAHMQLLLSVGFVVQMRINYSRSVRQDIITAVSLVISLFIPELIYRFKQIKKLGLIFGGVGFAALAAVYVLGTITYGAKLSVTLFGFTFQPSEFVKILFTFLIAGILAKTPDVKHAAISAVCAAAFALMLVASRDLGMALIFFMMYVAMLKFGTGKEMYGLPAFAAFTLAAVASYFMFSHVKVRVHAWLDPWSDIDNKGYQLTQSLFAIGTGGWFGMGIGRGKPYTIPDVEKDFVFSAVAEESGVLFGILLILILLCVIFNMLLLAGRLEDKFYRIVVMGLAVCFGTQVVLTIGGGTRFIPLTGVTLPLVASGGSSAMATCLLFAVIQGISLVRMDEIYGEPSEEDEEDTVSDEDVKKDVAPAEHRKKDVVPAAKKDKEKKTDKEDDHQDDDAYDEEDEYAEEDAYDEEDEYVDDDASDEDDEYSDENADDEEDVDPEEDAYDEDDEYSDEDADDEEDVYPDDDAYDADTSVPEKTIVFKKPMIRRRSHMLREKARVADLNESPEYEKSFDDKYFDEDPYEAEMESRHGRRRFKHK